MSARDSAKALKALQTGWNHQLPIDPIQITSEIVLTHTADGKKDRFPINVQGIPAHQLPDPEISSYAESCPNEQHYRCIYNASESPERQRFALAHSLGHILLGHLDPNEYGILEDTIFDPSTRNPEDQEANLFAETLLMPSHYVSHLSRQEDDVAELARRFGVSPVTMRYRLKSLRLL